MPQGAKVPSLPIRARVFFPLVAGLVVFGCALTVFVPTKAGLVFAYALLALAVAICTFGLLGATAAVNHKAVQLGGSVAGFVVVLAILLHTLTSTTQSLEFKIYLDDEPAPSGTVVRLPDAMTFIEKQTIDGKGEGKVAFSTVVSGSQVTLFIDFPSFKSKSIKVSVTPDVIPIRIRSSDLEKIAPPEPVGPTLLHTSITPPQDRLGWDQPPMAEFSFQSKHPTIPVVEFRKGDAQVPFIGPSDAVLTQQLAADEYKTIVDGSKVIAAMRPKDLKNAFTPHGLYEANVDFGEISKAWDFNFIYKADLANPETVFKNPDSKFRFVPLDGDGPTVLEISNTSKSGRMVAQPLVQKFEFKRRFVVDGLLTMSSTDFKSRPTFDLGIGDQWGDLLSVLLADAGTDGFSIKLAGEKGLTRENHLNNPRFPMSLDGSTREYFQVRFEDSNDDNRRILCKLYLSPTPVQMSNDEHMAFSREIDAHTLADGITSIRLKLWGVGTVHLYNLEIGAIRR